MADLQKYADDFLSELIDEAILGTSFEIHRSSRLGTLFIDDTDSSEEEKYKIVDEVGLDIFGQPRSGNKKTLECECPNCKRSLAASRFAPHLEKCMGMGRNSSRIASQRIANSGKLAAGLGESLCNDDDPEFGSDADWLSVYEGASTSRRASKKRKVDKNVSSPRLKGPISKSRGSTNSPRSNGSGAPSKISHTDHNDNVPIDVVGDTNLGNISGESPHGRNKSLFDPSLGTWEPQITGGERMPEHSTVAPPSGLVRKKTKTTKYSHTKKSKKKHTINQNYSFT